MLDSQVKKASFPGQKTGLRGFLLLLLAIFSKNSQLRCFSLLCCFFSLTDKVFHIAVLFIGDSQHANQPFFWQDVFHPLDVLSSVFQAGAMAHINGILHHGETVIEQTFPEVCVGFTLGLSFGRHIKEDKKPHNVVGVNPVETQFGHPYFFLGFGGS